MTSRRVFRQGDSVFLMLFFGLVIFGTIVLSSASSVLSYQRFGNSFGYMWHQILSGLLPGTLAFLFFAFVDYRILKKISFGLLIFSLILMLLVFVPGIGIKFGGAKSWVEIFGVLFQPSEVLKFTFLMYLATWLSSRTAHEVAHTHQGFIPFLSMMGVVAFLLILQPDIGTLSVIIFSSVVMFFVGGGSWKHLGVLMLGMAVAFCLLVFIAPYRMARFAAFVNPNLDPQGVGYHLNQASIAIGTGGWFGRGLGESRQKFAYLPEVMGDSIFAVMVEELGFIVSGCFVICYFLLLYRGLLIARQSHDLFARYVATGMVTWVSVQAFLNMGAMLGVVPLTGLPLPLVSFGGSALTVTMAGFGILYNLSRYRLIA